MKRNDISRLQKNRSIYFKLGMIGALSFALFAFNWTRDFYQPTPVIMEPVVEDIVQIERTTQLEKRLPPPPVIETKADLLAADPELITEPEPEPVAQLLDPSDRQIPEAPPVPVAQTRPAPMPVPAILQEDINDPGEIIFVVEEMPRFPGCEDSELSKKEKKACAEKKMLEYIYKNIHYPTLAKETGIEGTAVIRFVIEKDGSITDPQIVKEPGGGCGREALRVVKEMPKWIPGKQRGRVVRVQYNLPVKYELD